MTVNYAGLCQCAKVTASQPHNLQGGGDHHAMASSQGMLSEGEKRDEERVGFDLWIVEVSVMGCFINSCQCQPMHPSLILEGQSCVYQSRCILASSISLSVLACFAKRGHCVRRSESGMALGMMSLQSTHLTHASMYTTLCAMSHHLPFLFLNGGWNSVPSCNACCVCGANTQIIFHEVTTQASYTHYTVHLCLVLVGVCIY